MLGREGEQKLLFGAGEKEDNHWEMRWYKYPQIWFLQRLLRNPGTSGLDPGTSGNWRLQQADLGTAQNFREKLRGSGKGDFKTRSAS
jgi:hypothetical protein